ncbi:hypothetical protein ACTHOQ_06555 [Solibacillus silvestris]
MALGYCLPVMVLQAFGDFRQVEAAALETSRVHQMTAEKTD